MLLVKGMILLVADDVRAMLFETVAAPGESGLRLLGKREAEPAVAFSDQPGLGGDRATGHGTAFAQGDPERQARVQFAQTLATFVQAHLGGARLIVAAPPRMLAALREALPAAVSAQIVAELDKTLTGHPIPDLIKVITAALDPV